MFGFCIFCISFYHYMQCLVIQSKYKTHLSSFVSKKRSSGICFGNFVSIKFEFKSWANLNQNMVLSRWRIYILMQDINCTTVKNS